MVVSVTDEKGFAAAGSVFGDVRPPRRTGRDLVKELTEQGALDGLFAQIDSDELQVTGEGGFVPALGFDRRHYVNPAIMLSAPDERALPNSEVVIPELMRFT